MKMESFRNYSRASKERWAKYTQEERTSRLSAVAKIRWQNVSPEDRRAHAMKMVAARGLKDNKQTDAKIKERSERRDLQSAIRANSASTDGSSSRTSVADIAKLV